jgi:hypothetical protein
LKKQRSKVKTTGEASIIDHRLIVSSPELFASRPAKLLLGAFNAALGAGFAIGASGRPRPVLPVGPVGQEKLKTTLDVEPAERAKQKHQKDPPLAV